MHYNAITIIMDLCVLRYFFYGQIMLFFGAKTVKINKCLSNTRTKIKRTEWLVNDECFSRCKGQQNQNELRQNQRGYGNAKPH